MISSKFSNATVEDITRYSFWHALIALPFIEKIYLHGSRARGQQGARSDIDLAIMCPKASPKDWSRVREIIDHADTLIEIDCLRLDSAAAEITKNIVQEGLVLYERS